MKPVCIESIAVDSSVGIRGIQIPEGANCMAIQRRRCVFAYTNQQLEGKYFSIPEDSMEVSFPSYRVHEGRYIFYGKPVFKLNRSIKP